MRLPHRGVDDRRVVGDVGVERRRSIPWRRARASTRTPSRPARRRTGACPSDDASPSPPWPRGRRPGRSRRAMNGDRYGQRPKDGDLFSASDTEPAPASSREPHRTRRRIPGSVGPRQTWRGTLSASPRSLLDLEPFFPEQIAVRLGRAVLAKGGLGVPPDLEMEVRQPLLVGIDPRQRGLFLRRDGAHISSFLESPLTLTLSPSGDEGIEPIPSPSLRQRAGVRVDLLLGHAWVARVRVLSQ